MPSDAPDVPICPKCRKELKPHEWVSALMCEQGHLITYEALLEYESRQMLVWVRDPVTKYRHTTTIKAVEFDEAKHERFKVPGV